MALFVGQLSRDVRTSELREMFEEFGKLTRCELKSGRRADYAFLNYEEEKDAENALNTYQGKEIYGLRINIEWAHGGKRSEGRVEKCYECQEVGHFARDCRRRRERERRRSPRRERYRSPSPRRRSKYSSSPSRSPRRYRRSRSPSPRRYRRSRSPSYERSPRRYRSRERDYSPSPRRERERSYTPRRERSPVDYKAKTSPRNDLKRPLESTHGEPPEKRSRIE